MASLRIDPQGKAYGQMALEMMVSVPEALLRSMEGHAEDAGNAERALSDAHS
jgi:hypothetical protein